MSCYIINSQGQRYTIQPAAQPDTLPDHPTHPPATPPPPSPATLPPPSRQKTHFSQRRNVGDVRIQPCIGRYANSKNHFCQLFFEPTVCMLQLLTFLCQTRQLAAVAESLPSSSRITATGCLASDIDIQCDRDQFIRVTGANYGHKLPVCGPASNATTRCNTTAPSNRT